MATLAEVIDELKQGTDATHDVASEVSKLNTSFQSFFNMQKGKKLDDLEKEREKKQGSATPSRAAAAASGSQGAAGTGGTSKLGGLLSGFGLAGAGIGLGAMGAGIGAFFMGLAGAEAIMQKFGNGDNLYMMMVNLADGLAAFSDRDLAALGALLGAGALFGAMPLISGMGAGIGVAAIGLGIGAFFTALSASDMAIGEMEAVGVRLKLLMRNLAEGLSEFNDDQLVQLGGLLAAGGGLGALFGAKRVGSAAFGIAAIGAGVAAFFAAFGAADLAISEMGASGESIKSIMVNFGQAISSFDQQTLATLGALGGVAALASLFPGGQVAVAGSLAAVGVGVGAFFAGLAVADKGIQVLNSFGSGKPGEGFRDLLKNTAEGVGAFTNIKFDENLGSGLTGIGNALVDFFSADFIKTITEVLAPVKEAFLTTIDFIFGTGFAEESRKSPIQKLVDGLEPLKSIDADIIRTLNTLPPALDTMATSFERLSGIDVTDFGKGMLSATQGLLFASDAMLGLQTGRIANGSSVMDPNDYFGGFKFGNAIRFPDGGIVNTTSNVNVNEIRTAIDRVYDALGVSRMSEARENLNLIERQLTEQTARINANLVNAPSQTDVTNNTTNLNANGNSSVDPMAVRGPR